MKQLPCVGLYNPCINSPFGDSAINFDHGLRQMVTFLPYLGELRLAVSMPLLVALNAPPTCYKLLALSKAWLKPDRAKKVVEVKLHGSFLKPCCYTNFEKQITKTMSLRTNRNYNIVVEQIAK